MASPMRSAPLRRSGTTNTPLKRARAIIAIATIAPKPIACFLVIRRQAPHAYPLWIVYDLDFDAAVWLQALNEFLARQIRRTIRGRFGIAEPTSLGHFRMRYAMRREIGMDGLGPLLRQFFVIARGANAVGETNHVNA